ncbi:MAG: 4Fe-4S dicluster domain-containing protein [Finegoldia sp.]|nr:4Fe-4S dicluster domain-containing protein [Finegoldia sp.]
MEILSLLLKKLSRIKLNPSLCLNSKSTKIKCNNCMEICPNKAINIENGRISISYDCKSCGICTSVCPSKSIELKEPDEFSIYKSIKNGDIEKLSCRYHDNYERSYFDCFCIGNFSNELILSILIIKPDLLLTFQKEKCSDCKYHIGFDKFFYSLKEETSKISDQEKVNLKNDLAHSVDYDEGRREFLKNIFNPSTYLNLNKIDKYQKNVNYNMIMVDMVYKNPQIFHLYNHKSPVKAKECIMCKACVKLCPSSALKFLNKDIYLNPMMCSSCNLCSDICYDDCLKMKDTVYEDFDGEYHPIRKE